MMINTLLGLPKRVLRKILSPFRGSSPAPAAPPKTRPPMPEPPAWMRQDDHDDGHDHGHSHSHSHSHEHHDEPEPPEEQPSQDHDHQHEHASPIDVIPIETPNPNAYKFSTNQQISKASFSANNREAAQNHPISKALFEIEGVAAVFGVNDFVTVTKEENADWSTLIPATIEALQKSLSS